MRLNDDYKHNKLVSDPKALLIIVTLVCTMS